MDQMRALVLKDRPIGLPNRDTFELISLALPDPGEGEIQVQNRWMSVDPVVRTQMHSVRSYSPTFQVGDILTGGAIGEVVASRDASFRVGDLVISNLGWREAFNAPAAELRKLDADGLPPQVFLGVAGIPGMTAYVGLFRFADLHEGDVVYVSGAAGAIGSVVCQIAKLKGHKVIGSAGGPAKVAFLREIGVDVAIDYKAEADFPAALVRAVPEGIDVFFDNVGGTALEAAIAAANVRARIVLCGASSLYNGTGQTAGPPDLIQTMRKKELTMRGYVSVKYVDMFAAFDRDILAWIKSGQIKWKETIYEGLESAPDALAGLFTGDNLGKTLVRL